MSQQSPASPVSATTDAATPSSKHPHFTKIDAAGTALPDDAAAWFAVRVVDGSIAIDILAECVGKAMPHAKCETAVAALDAGGFTDWRLPTVRELERIVDRARHSPAVDPQFFPAIKSDWYWTSDAVAWSSASAWSVFFNDGFVSSIHRDYSGFALAFRRAGQ